MSKKLAGNHTIPIFGTQQYSRNDALIIQKAAQQRYDERMENS